MSGRLFVQWIEVEVYDSLHATIFSLRKKEGGGEKDNGGRRSQCQSQLPLSCRGTTFEHLAENKYYSIGRDALVRMCFLPRCLRADLYRDVSNAESVACCRCMRVGRGGGASARKAITMVVVLYVFIVYQ